MLELTPIVKKLCFGQTPLTAKTMAEKFRLFWFAYCNYHLSVSDTLCVIHQNRQGSNLVIVLAWASLG